MSHRFTPANGRQSRISNKALFFLFSAAHPGEEVSSAYAVHLTSTSATLERPRRRSTGKNKGVLAAGTTGGSSKIKKPAAFLHKLFAKKEKVGCADLATPAPISESVTTSAPVVVGGGSNSNVTTTTTTTVASGGQNLSCDAITDMDECEAQTADPKCMVDPANDNKCVAWAAPASCDAITDEGECNDQGATLNCAYGSRFEQDAQDEWTVEKHAAMCYDCSAAVDDTITEVTAELQCTKGTGDKCKFDQDDKCVAAAVDGTPPPEAGPTCTSEEHTGKLCIQTAGQYCETIAPSAPLPAFADGDTCSRKTPYNGTGITWTTPLDWQALHRNVNWYWKADLCRADCQNDANCAWYTTIHGGTLVDDTGADWQNQDHKNCEEVEWIKATTGEFAGLWSPNSALLTTGKTACTWKYDCILFNACPVLEEF